ncbi:MAG: penicillin-binding protein 2 [Verrucomicrobiota bacterium]
MSARLVFLQWQGEESLEVSASPGRSVKTTLVAQRGYLCDRDEEIVARNIPVTTIVLDKKNLADSSVVAAGVAFPRAVMDEEWHAADERGRDRILKRVRNDILSTQSPNEIVEQHMSFLIAVLAPRLGYDDRDKLRAKIGKIGRGETILAKNLEEDVADDVERIVRENRLQGLRFKKSFRRWYPNPELASHVVGIVNHEGLGVAGIEKSMARYLEGKDGYELTKRDVRNLPLGKSSGVVKPPISGLIVQLTVDLDLQAVLEEELDAGLEFAEAEKGCIVLMEPDSGEVLAMASRPTYDLNKRENVATGGVNFATQAVYEPGSTFKVIAISACMERGLVNSQTPVFCHNGHYDDLNINDVGTYGWLSVERVLAKSSNIGTYMLAKQLGRSSFYRYVDLYGFGKRTGITLGGERSGLIANKNNAVDFSRASYGYAVNVTPLQVANAYCALANGGKLMRPRVVKSVMANDGTRVCEFEPEVVNEVISAVTANRMRRSLEAVVKPGGTATRAAVPGYRIAGKTGTARKFQDGRYHMDKHVVSFAGILSTERPELVCVVVVDEPKTEEVPHGGGTIAAPIFSKTMGRIAATMGLKPVEPLVENTLASE